MSTSNQASASSSSENLPSAANSTTQKEDQIQVTKEDLVAAPVDVQISQNCREPASLRMDIDAENQARESPVCLQPSRRCGSLSRSAN